MSSTNMENLEEPLVATLPSDAYGTHVLDQLWPAFDVPEEIGMPSSARARTVAHIDDKGNVSLLEFHKHDVVRDIGVRYREAIMLDPLIPIPFPASILIREKALIVNLEAVRMIICANQCWILSVPKVGDLSSGVPPTVDHPFVVYLSQCLAHLNDPVFNWANFQLNGNEYDASVHLGAAACGGDAPLRMTTYPSSHVNPSLPFNGDATRKIDGSSDRSKSITGKEFDADTPYELRALEVALKVVLRALRIEMHLLESTGYPALGRMTKRVTGQTLRQVRDLKKDLAEVTKRVETLRSEVDKILKSDHDMADMYLGRKAIERGLGLPPQPGEKKFAPSAAAGASTTATAAAVQNAPSASPPLEDTGGGEGVEGLIASQKQRRSSAAATTATASVYGGGDGAAAHDVANILNGLPAASKRALEHSASSVMQTMRAAHAWKHATGVETLKESRSMGAAGSRFAAVVAALAAVEAVEESAAARKSSRRQSQEEALLSQADKIRRSGIVGGEKGGKMSGDGSDPLADEIEEEQTFITEGIAERFAAAAATFSTAAGEGSPHALHPYGLVDPHDIEACEDLMESAFLNLDQILRSMTLMAERISHDELLLRINMDSTRNQLVLLELWVSNVTMGFAWVAMLAGIFGMNFVDSSGIANMSFFYIVMAIGCVGMIMLPGVVMWYLRRRRLTMTFDAAL